MKQQVYTLTHVAVGLAGEVAVAYGPDRKQAPVPFPARKAAGAESPRAFSFVFRHQDPRNMGDCVTHHDASPFCPPTDDLFLK